MSEIIIKVDLEGAGETLKATITDLETFKQLLLDIKANKNALASAETIANVQKLTAELKKAELQVAQLQQKSIASREKENNKLKEQSGIIGQLIQKKKDLGKELFSAKTVDDVRKINSEIAKTNLEIVKLKNVGVSSFNTFEKALASFQFKFNFLGNLVGNLASGIFSSGIGLITTAIGLAITKLDLFGDAAKEAFGKGEATKLEGFKNNLASITDEYEFQLRLLAAQGEETKGLELSQKRQLLTQLENLAFQQEIASLNLKMSDEQKEEAKKGFAETKKSIRDTEQDIEVLTKEIEKSKTDTIKKEIDKRREERKKELTEIEKSQSEIQDVNKNAAKLNADLLKEERDRRNDFIQDELGKSIAVENTRFARQKRDIKKLFDESTLSEEQKKKILQDIETEHQIKINAIVKKATDEQTKIEVAASDAAIEANNAELESFQKNVKSAKEDTKERKKLAEEKAKAEIEAAEKVSDAFFKQLELRNKRQQTANEQAISELDRQIDFQQELALKGEKNTLGELEKERAKALEQKAAIEERERRQKEAQQLVEIFFEFMKVYAKDKDAGFGKAIAATLTAKAFASAFAAEGGMMADLIQPMAGGSNEKGLFKGRSHARGGILTLLETQGGEGILTDKEVNNLGGAKGFYMLKDLLANPVKDDFLEHQEQSFAKAIPIMYKDDRKEYRQLTGKIDELIDTVRNKTEWTISENLFGELVKIRREKGNVRTTIVKNTPIINGR